MKNNSIDNLFREKLAEHRQEPSQRALEKFQQKLAQRESKPKGGMVFLNRQWNYLAAAASMVAIMGIGFLLNNNQPTKPLAKAESPMSQPAIEHPSVEIPTNVQQKSIVNTTPKIIRSTAQPSITVSYKQIIKEENKTQIADNQVVKVQEDVSVEVKPEPAKPEITTSLAAIEPKEAKPEEVVLIFDETQLRNATKPLTAEETLVANQEDEKSFISKLVTEYKHFKYGEKVDFKNLGINKNTVLAKVDERLFKEEREDIRGFVQRNFLKNRRVEE